MIDALNLSEDADVRGKQQEMFSRWLVSFKDVNSRMQTILKMETFPEMQLEYKETMSQDDKK